MLQPGSQIAHFKIIEKLGQGGMGAVYLAEDQKLHRNVALKTLTSEMFDNTDHQERFVREARTAAQISHGNVMAIYDIDSAVDPATGKSIQYIVMEYIKGQSLTHHLRASRIDMAGTVRMAEKIASGLAAAHKLHIVHRDIKTDNIMVDEQSEPKILDFGLAKPVDPVRMSDSGSATNTVSQELTKAGKILGTVSYMSPEQIKGEPIDTRSDIFSFGILLYRMATGQSPFEGGTQVSTLAKILESAPEPPHLKNADVPAELDRIIEKCLQKDANDRYQDTRDLVVDLRNLRKSYDSGSTDTVAMLREKSGKANKAKISGFSLGWKGMTLAIFGMILLFAVIMELIDGNGPRRAKGGLHAGETGIAILGFDNRTGDTSLNWLGTGLPEILITDLAQNQSLRVISRQRLLDAIGTKGSTPTDEELRDAASELGAINLLTGTYFKLGDQVRIDARLEDISSGNIILAEKVVGGDPFKLVDSLSHKIRLALNIGTSGAASSGGIAQLITSSPDAYKQYLAGMELFNRSEYDSSIAVFQSALSLDSTLALAYMRIGMAHTFSGRQQKGMGFFAKARQLQDRLPVRERSMLDVYANIWLDRQIGQASTKIKQMVANYPDDKEIRIIYGLFLAQLDKDTVGGFAQFDTALQIDPTYVFALGVYGQIYALYQQYDKAVEFARRTAQIVPGSAQPHEQAGGYLGRMGRYDAAISEYDQALGINPNNYDVLLAEFNLHLRFQQIDRAASLLPSLQKVAGDDPYRLINYYGARADLAGWRGEFRNLIQEYRGAIKEGIRTQDNGLTYSCYSSLIGTFQTFEWKDSVRKYAARADSIAGPFQKLSYPLTLIDIDAANEKTARPVLVQRLNDFRERLPASLWPQADALQSIFDAVAKHDTAAWISALQRLINSAGQPISGNSLELGTLLVCVGRYAEGKTELEPLLSGMLRTSDPLTYLQVAYYLGRAEEGLGNRKSAVEYYQTILKYWSGADIATKEISDAKARLAKLTG